ncbi:Ig-like domain-containing protein, partial [Candidatus Micrarchaeota archaeon]|nr:Ig-like domain-containing protein [Candidatus Micrarchaeota archaeon]
TILNPLNQTYNDSTPDLNFTVSENATCWYYLDGAGPTMLPGCNNITLPGPLTDGGHNVTVYANDTAGNTNSTTVIFTIDATLPAVTIILPQNTTYGVSTLPLNYTANDTNLQSCWYVLDGGAPNYSISSCNNVTLPALADGAHNVTVYANDSAGNTGSDSEWFSIDTLPPNVTIISPANTTYPTSIPILYTAVDPNLYTCWMVIDGITTVPLPGCVNGSISTFDGPHNITIYANDTFGREGNDTEYFTKITNCPIISVPGLFTMAGNYIGAPNDASELLDGPDMACVKIASSDVVFDCAGYSITNNGTNNAAGIVINGSLSVDYTNVTIMNCPSVAGYTEGVYLHHSSGGAVQNSTALSGLDGFRLYYADDNELSDNTAYNNSRSGFLLTESNGNELADDYAYDNGQFGFIASSSANNSFQNGIASNSSIGFYMLMGSGNNLTDCISRGNNASGLYARDDPSLLVERMHFYDNLYDFRGEAVSGSDMPYQMYNAIFDSPGGAFANFTNLSINDSIDYNTSYVIDWQQMIAPPAGSFSFEQKYVLISTSFGAGQMTSVVFHWTDAESSSQPYYNESRFYLGNYYSASWSNASAALDTAAYTLTLTNQTLDGRFAILQHNTTDLPPAVNLVSPANGSAFNVASLNFTFNAVDDNSTQLNCSLNLDGAQNGTNSSTQNATNTAFAISGLADGLHLWNVSCTDGAMNTNTSETWEFTIDTAAPTVTIQSPANITYGSGFVDLNYSVNDSSGISSCWYVLDGAPAVALPPGCFNITLGVLPNGGHNMTVYANDTLGNTGSATVIFTVDTSLPTVLILSPANTTYAVATLDLDYYVLGANIDSCWYSLDGGANTSLPGCANDTLVGLADGGHNVSVYANNTLGLTGYFTRYFTVDATPPVVNITSPTNSTYNTTSIPLNYTATDNFGIHTCWYVRDGGAPIPLPGCQNTTLSFANGSHNITVYANDSAGNNASDTEYFTVNVTGGDGDDGDDDDRKKNMVVDYSFICPGDLAAFNVTTPPAPVANVEIKIIYDTYPAYYVVDIIHTGSNGTADVALSQNGTYTFRATRADYVLVEGEFDFTACPPEFECQDDVDCPGDSQCVAGNCEKISCDCGYIQNYSCVRYACCADTDCPSGESCLDNQCKKRYECTSDGDCLGAQYCDISQGEAGGDCKDVTGCGEVQDHALVPYEFPYGCAMAECPACPQQFLCRENMCVNYNLTAPPTAFVGDNITLNASEGPSPCRNCSLVIVFPDRRQTTVQTDGNGQYVLPVAMTGSYSASLVVDGQTITSIVVAAITRTTTDDSPLPDWTTFCLPLLLILLLLLLIFFLWRRGKKDIRAAVVTESPAMGKSLEVKVFRKNKEAVPNARVDVFLEGKAVAQGLSNKFGRFSFIPGAKGRYAIHVNGSKSPEATFIIV